MDDGREMFERRSTPEPATVEQLRRSGVGRGRLLFAAQHGDRDARARLNEAAELARVDDGPDAA